MGAPVRKIPERRCSGCGESFPNKDLLRVVRAPDGSVSLDFTGKKSGRGAYICKKEACLKKAIKSKRIQSNLEVEISESLIDNLTKELSRED